MVNALIDAITMKVRLRNYFLAGDAMSESNKGYCSICFGGLTESSEYIHDLDVALFCKQCDRKTNWFVSGLLVGIVAASLIFYLLYRGMQ